MYRMRLALVCLTDPPILLVIEIHSRSWNFVVHSQISKSLPFAPISQCKSFTNNYKSVDAVHLLRPESVSIWKSTLYIGVVRHGRRCVHSGKDIKEKHSQQHQQCEGITSNMRAIHHTENTNNGNNSRWIGKERFSFRL